MSDETTADNLDVALLRDPSIVCWRYRYHDSPGWHYTSDWHRIPPPVLAGKAVLEALRVFASGESPENGDTGEKEVEVSGIPASPSNVAASPSLPDPLTDEDRGYLDKLAKRGPHTDKGWVEDAIDQTLSLVDRLLAENERLRQAMGGYRITATRLMAERDRLLEAGKSVLVDHDERMTLYPTREDRPNRVLVMGELRAALAGEAPE